jgi:hypothetical protein
MRLKQNRSFRKVQRETRSMSKGDPRERAILESEKGSVDCRVELEGLSAAIVRSPRGRVLNGARWR